MSNDHNKTEDCEAVEKPHERHHEGKIQKHVASEGPIAVTFEDITAAAFRIKNGIKKTICEKSCALSDLLQMDVYLKREYMQVTGSFKERGARNTLLLLTKQQKAVGVIAASAGNHALALAYHGKELNIPVTVCMPTNAPITKVSRCKKYGATVYTEGTDVIEAKEFALKIAQEKGFVYINGYDHPDILAGQGTCGIEMVEDVNGIDAIVIPTGGGGLIAGCAVAIKNLQPNIEVISVESEKCASFKAAFEAGKPVKIAVEQSITLADGLCVSTVGENAFFTARPYVDKVVSVSEPYIAMAVLRLVESEKCVVEGAGATGLAAGLSGQLSHLKGKRVVFLLSGGNIDSTVLGRVIDRGLAADGRLIRFSAVISDRPGGLLELARVLAEHGASVKDIFHERAWLQTTVFKAEIKVICEVRDYEHGCALRKILEIKYDDVNWLTNTIHDKSEN
ncbi:L-threonine ammonia-lyase-like [Hydra vulgaris]|uniref:L-serine deaminase n=1 Tax=Hydra vulgaris TaxID=6087 RepID=A0ABM4CAI7_HYDVU